MQGRLSKWGNSCGVRIPKDLLAKSGLKEGATVEFSAEEGRIILSAAKPKRKKYTLKELLADTTPEDYRNALSPEDYKFFQTDVGREIIDE